MAEYGQAVGQVSGQGGGGGGGPQDIGGAAMDFVTHAVDRVSALPVETQVIIVVLLLLGLIVLRRAF